MAQKWTRLKVSSDLEREPSLTHNLSRTYVYIYIDSDSDEKQRDYQNLSWVTTSGHGLRETLFYHLFSLLQVYRTMKDMYKALPFIKDGAVSLDGGIMSPGVFDLGHWVFFCITFKISSY